MKRSRLTTRTWLQRRKRINPVSVKERTRVAPVWRQVKEQVFARAGDRCEVTLTSYESMDLMLKNARERERFVLWRDWQTVRCLNRADDGDHVKKPRRSNNRPECVLAICRPCHNWKDEWHGAPRGKLMAEPSSDGAIAPRTWIQRVSKFEARGADGLGTVGS